jgi:hypothetical protein
VLHAQPSPTTRSLFASRGPWSSTTRRRQQTGAVGPPTLLQHIHAYIQIRDPVSLSLKPNPETKTHTPDDNVFCAPGNIIIIPTSPRSLTRSLARWLAPTHPPTHATRLPKLPSDNADRFCFYLLHKYPLPACLLTAWLACICILDQYQTPCHTCTHVTRLWSTADTKRPQTPSSSPDLLLLLLLLLAVQRTSITRLAPRPWLVRPVLPAFEQKRRPDHTTDPRPCLFFPPVTSPTTVTLVPAALRLCDQPPTHFATTTIPQLTRPTNIQPSP